MGLRRSFSVPGRVVDVAAGLRVFPAEFSAVNGFKRFLARELEAMGVHGKFNVAFSQSIGKFFPEAVERYSLGKMPDGHAECEVVSERHGETKYAIRGLRPLNNDSFVFENKLCHEACHAAVYELMKQCGWRISPGRDFPSETNAPTEGIAVSLHLEKASENKRAFHAILRLYERSYKNFPGYNDHVLGLQLAKAILTVAPNSLSDRRLLRWQAALFCFREHGSIHELLRILEDKEAKTGMKRLREGTKRLTAGGKKLTW